MGRSFAQPRRPEPFLSDWVHPHVDWCLTGYPPLGYPYPGVVQYIYADAGGREIKHGLLIERGVCGNHGKQESVIYYPVPDLAK